MQPSSFLAPEEIAHGSLPQRLRAAARRDGWGSVARTAAQRLVGSLIWIERVAFYDSNPGADRHAAASLPAEPITVRAANADELLGRFRERLARRLGIGRDDLIERLGRGQRAIIALHRDELVGMLWLGFDGQRIGEIGRRLVLRPGEFLTYNELTLEEWRGHGIGVRMNLEAERVAREYGATRRVTWRRLGNHAAVRVAAKMGDRRFAVVTAVRLFGRNHALVFGLRAPELVPLVA